MVNFLESITLFQNPLIFTGCEDQILTALMAMTYITPGDVNLDPRVQVPFPNIGKVVLVLWYFLQMLLIHFKDLVCRIYKETKYWLLNRYQCVSLHVGYFRTLQYARIKLTDVFSYKFY